MEFDVSSINMMFGFTAIAPPLVSGALAISVN
jgi:hypothetical protein